MGRASALVSVRSMGIRRSCPGQLNLRIEPALMRGLHGSPIHPIETRVHKVTACRDAAVDGIQLGALTPSMRTQYHEAHLWRNRRVRKRTIAEPTSAAQVSFARDERRVAQWRW
jgi:hypothetical protein